MNMTAPIRLISGNANKELAVRISKVLGIPLVKVLCSKFANGETRVEILESIRDCDVFVIQPTCNPSPNDFLMELLIICDTLRRAAVKRITGVVPSFGYARQDRKDKSRVPISSKLVANLLQVAGFDRIITMDLHASQIQGFFDIPLDNLYFEPLYLRYLRRLPGKVSEKCIVSPDVGGVKRAKSTSDKLKCDLVVMHKERPRPGEVSDLILVGDVTDKICVLVDDIADTCGTVCRAAEKLMASGAKAVYVCVTHGVFSPPAFKRLNEAPIVEVITSNSIPQKENRKVCSKLTIIDLAPTLAEAIRRNHNGESISKLFQHTFSDEDDDGLVEDSWVL